MAERFDDLCGMNVTVMRHQFCHAASVSTHLHPERPMRPLISSAVINSNNSCVDNRLSIPSRSAGAVISRPCFLLPALHPVARALQQFEAALDPPAVVVILCRFPRRNFRIRQQYPRRHRLPRCLQPHAVHFSFQRGMPPFAPLGIGFLRQYNFRPRHFQCHLFALVMHVFVETVVGFPLKFLCFVR